MWGVALFPSSYMHVKGNEKHILGQGEIEKKNCSSRQETSSLERSEESPQWFRFEYQRVHPITLKRCVLKTFSLLFAALLPHLHFKLISSASEQTRVWFTYWSKQSTSAHTPPRSLTPTPTCTKCLVTLLFTGLTWVVSIVTCKASTSHFKCANSTYWWCNSTTELNSC